MPNDQIGFLGLGAMGTPMAKHIQKYLAETGSNLLYFNRTESKGQDLKDAGATAAKSVEELVSKSSIVFSMLSNDAALIEVVDKVVAALQPTDQSTTGNATKLFVSFATVSPQVAEQAGKKIEAAGAHFLAAPVFGLPVVAERAQLMVYASGQEAQFDRARPYFAAFSKFQKYLGSDYKKAQLMKLAGNTFIMEFMEIIGEASVLAEKSGIPTEDMTEWAGLVGGPFLELYFSKNSKGMYSPGPGGKALMSVDLAVKDSTLIKAQADSVGVPLPALDVALGHFRELESRPEDNLDGSAVYGLLRTKSGLPFDNDFVKQRDHK